MILSRSTRLRGASGKTKIMKDKIIHWLCFALYPTPVPSYALCRDVRVGNGIRTSEPFESANVAAAWELSLLFRSPFQAILQKRFESRMFMGFAIVTQRDANNARLRMLRDPDDRIRFPVG